MATVLSVSPELPLRDRLRAFVQVMADAGRPLIDFTEHGELRLDWPGCEDKMPAEQAIAIMAALDPHRLLDWLEAETMAQLKGRDRNGNVVEVTLQ